MSALSDTARGLVGSFKVLFLVYSIPLKSGCKHYPVLYVNVNNASSFCMACSLYDMEDDELIGGFLHGAGNGS